MIHSADVTVTSRSGLHSRPAANLAKLVSHLDSTVTLHAGSKSVNASSVLALITAGVVEGQTVTIECVGENAESDLTQIITAIAAGLGD